jgi:hypothetical protein
MCGLGQVHDDERDGRCEGCGQPLQAWVRIGLQVEVEDGRNDDAY